MKPRSSTATPLSARPMPSVDGTIPTVSRQCDPCTVLPSASAGLLLVRTLENTNGLLPSASQLVEDVFPSLVFFQDTYNMRVENILIGGAMGAEEAGDTLQSQTGIPVRNLVSATLGSAATPGSVMAGVVGALAS